MRSLIHTYPYFTIWGHIRPRHKWIYRHILGYPYPVLEHIQHCPMLGYTEIYSAISHILGHNRIYLAIPCHTSIIVGHSRSYRTIIWHGNPYRTISVHARPYWLIHNHTKRNRLIFCHTAPYSVTLGNNWKCYGAITYRIESHLIIPMNSRGISSFIQHTWPHSSVQIHVR